MHRVEYFQIIQFQISKQYAILMADFIRQEGLMTNMEWTCAMKEKSLPWIFVDMCHIVVNIEPLYIWRGGQVFDNYARKQSVGIWTRSN
jgi:hypothetical protein